MAGPRKPNFTAEYLRSIVRYAPETGIFTRLVKIGRNNKALPGSVAGCVYSNGYRYVAVKGRDILAATLVWYYMTGMWPTQIVDHINRQRSDDRWVNLRLATSSQNQFNKSMMCTNTSGHKGISWMPSMSKWQAHIHYHRKQKNLGHFDTLEDAVKARKIAEKELHGEFAIDGGSRHHTGLG